MFYRGIAFNGGGSSSFPNDFARDVVTLGVDNISSAPGDNLKNSFSVLVEETTDGISDGVGTSETKLSINFTKANMTFSLSLHYNNKESYFYHNKTDISKFKAHDNLLLLEFCFVSI